MPAYAASASAGSVPTARRERLAGGTQQILTFKLGTEEYGLGVLTVQEIRGWSAVTAIPHAPAWVLGVIDLRGVVVPVIDLRRRFELAPAEFGPATVVIVLRIAGGGEERTIGLLVDAVSEVYDIDGDNIRELPEIGSRVAGDVVTGLVHVDGKTVMLLDAQRLIASASQ
jgi:purine-binding chemotaxis protein CheW